MMYADVDVHMEEGEGQADADKSRQGGRRSKITKFLQKYFMDSPLAPCLSSWTSVTQLYKRYYKPLFTEMVDNRQKKR